MKYFLLFSLLGISLLQSANIFAQSSRSQATRSSSFKGGGLFDFAFYYGQTEGSSDPDNSYQAKNNESYYDMKLGYVFNSGVYFGAEYNARNSGYVGGSTTGNGAAAGLGYFFQNGINLRGYYRFNESFSDFRNGTGVQADAGYSQLFATNFYLGIMLSYRKTNYTKRDSDPTLTRYSFDSTYPMLTVGFLIN
jgi:hypothetical protein